LAIHIEYSFVDSCLKIRHINKESIPASGGGNDVAASSQGMNAWNKKAAGVFLLQPRDKNQFNMPAVCNQHVY
jgi:hypothetical protein